jgi:putative tryptophan/tyrosine transport system substrate-binding protein
VIIGLSRLLRRAKYRLMALSTSIALIFAPLVVASTSRLLCQPRDGLRSLQVNGQLEPVNAFHTASMRQAFGAAQALGIKLQALEVRTSEELDGAFAAIVRTKPDALLILADRVFLHNRQRIMDFASEHRLPSVNAYRELVEAGGLMSYGPSYEDMHRRAADYVDKILKGAKPGDLPVEQPTKFTLVVNLKAAKALGLAVPPMMLSRADEVIE